ncbi:MAG: calcium/sodium antiporter [Coriobacteriia bacterium]|nr:calcium/sodium antiporter [Coriobacteriia bacterium]MBN2839863.1 calcium/sodium antiporter [Coriobacteriia bacterium]
MYLAALLGFVLLFGGGEGLVRGAVAVARRFGLSSLLIGLTVVAAGTSAPELIVSLSAAIKGNADIALGNVVGSNIFNVLGVLGISALIAPIIVKPAEVKRDTLIMAGAMVALAVAAQSGVIGWPVGSMLIVAVIGYTVYSYRTELREKPAPSAELHEHEGEEFEGPSSLWLGLLYIALGLGALVIGSQLLVTGATEIARTFGVPEAVIGLTLVAIGTSLPELATSIAAAVRGHSDVAVGNVLGSNIFNALLIIGATAVVRPIGVAESMARLDVWLMVAAALALIPLLIGRGRIGRVAGVVLTASYAIYAVLLLA